jgi:DNA-directed RNA polymerase subunit M
MDFCPECSSILTPQKNGKSRILVCKSCGYTKRLSSKAKKKYKIADTINHGPEETIVVIDEKLAKQQSMPTVRAICPKCGHKIAYYWQVQTRSGDEGMTTFYRCVKCSQTWREY